MTAAEPKPEHNRRATDRAPGLSDTQRLRRLVRFLAADPLNVAWLGRHNARLLEQAAMHLQLRGDTGSASRLREIAQAHRSGQVSPF